jgi:hypothetical protein
MENTMSTKIRTYLTFTPTGRTLIIGLLITLAMPGSTIKVRPGTDIEEIVIARDLTVVGEGLEKTVVQTTLRLGVRQA